MAITTDFRLYHSNALEVLAELLADELRKPVAGRDVLEHDVILIPQVAMRRWLQAALAEKFGVVANLQFLTPGELVRQALDANLGLSQDDLDQDALRWRLYAALGDATLLARPAMARMAAYVGLGSEEAAAAKRWALAGELAGIFNNYSAWRRDWLLRWDAGADPDDPQALLWRAIAHGQAHRARRIGEYLAKYSDGDALPTGLPSRLFVFATLNVSPDVLRVLATQARVGTLHFYLPSPVKEYWGDLQAPRAQDAHENPLLRDWGAAGKEFMALLGGYEVVHPSGAIDSSADPVSTNAGAPTSLLRHMQSDLLHRRAIDTTHLRARVDTADVSLQWHACHTRLRELHVLHDRLRALLDPASPEGRQFDPPLRPRDIAVLAPDIDHYAPYLDAVFGGDAQHGRIPYAVADASPLQGEPLADIFLRLLALPVSRFGLEDVLDLLASPPLADAANLHETDIERLRVWLHAAGVRWGLDAAHRARSGAPEEAAYTWQFALDRLLLGHASGSDALMEGVAPWPELEGSALAILDRALQVLRVLAQHEQRFREAMPPVQWRDVLLKLLQTLLPNAPTDPAAQRTHERLRKLITDFATQAERAGFRDSIPFEVVRAHFNAQLSDADTRAPLLTGGVSFARMVPMRLLPFRVICLLGMNDGDFPRSDPAAGLNRLTAELGTDRRRLGDRSTRDDDRYLFLQLFAAAQDVFYLSWIGNDLRDGSEREPSALVTELLATAAAYHADAASHDVPVHQQLVLRHALQPYSANAFGDGNDPRRFSYRSDWQAALAFPADQRSALPAWMPAGRVLTTADAETQALSIDTLKRFFKAPAEQFLRQRLALRLPELDEAHDDIEPLQMPTPGLEKHALKRALFDALLAGQEEASILESLRGRALLPAGALGVQVLRALMVDIAPYADAFVAWRGAALPSCMALEVEVDGVRVHGQLQDAYPHGIARLRFGEPNGHSVLRNGLDWLLVCAAGAQVEVVELQDSKDHGIGAHPRPRCTQADAVASLRALLQLYREGQKQVLPFAPYSGWALYAAGDNINKGLGAARTQWCGSGQAHSFAERDDASQRLALRGRELLTDRAEMQEFARITGIIFGAVTQAMPAPIALGEAELPDASDAEETA